MKSYIYQVNNAFNKAIIRYEGPTLVSPWKSRFDTRGAPKMEVIYYYHQALGSQVIFYSILFESYIYL
jgi:hypothetical protein